MNKQKRLELRKKKEAGQARLEKMRVEAEAQLEKQLEQPTQEIDASQFDARPNDEIEKDYYGAGTDMPMPMANPMPMMEVGPTSWEELDEREAIEEMAEAVEEATWDVRSLVHNILNDPEMDVEDKSDAIAEVGTGFAPRVNEIMGMNHLEEETAKKDLDALQIESLLAQDARRSGIVERVTGILKEKLSYRSRKNMESSQFALPEKRKYPIHDKAHVRNALARAAQQINRGGVGAADAKAALPKIRAAAKKYGIGVSKENTHNAILIEKDKNGDWRWVGWVSNNYVDWDTDIIAESAHKEYVEWLNKNMDLAPVLLAWHTPGTAHENAVDYAAYEQGFLVMSGKLTEGEAQSLIKMQGEVDLGMSHNSFVLGRDPKDARVILKYRTAEVTHLPLEKAANPFTNFEAVTKEAGMDLKTYLIGIYGSAEKAQAFLDRTGLAKKTLDAAGLESKEKKAETPEATPEIEVPAKAVPAPNMEAIIKAVEEHLGMKDLATVFSKMQEDVDKVPVLEAIIKDLQGSQDKKLAEMLTPPAARYPWMQSKRASASAETVLKDNEEGDKKLKAAAPNSNWMAEVFGVQPVSSEQVEQSV